MHLENKKGLKNHSSGHRGTELLPHNRPLDLRVLSKYRAPGFSVENKPIPLKEASATVQDDYTRTPLLDIGIHDTNCEPKKRRASWHSFSQRDAEEASAKQPGGAKLLAC